MNMAKGLLVPVLGITNFDEELRAHAQDCHQSHQKLIVSDSNIQAGCARQACYKLVETTMCHDAKRVQCMFACVALHLCATILKP